MFYKRGKKTALSCIDSFLNPLVLIVWSIEVGTTITCSGLELRTNHFSFDECLTIAQSLHKCFNLEASVRRVSLSNFVIYIPKKSMLTLHKTIEY